MSSTHRSLPAAILAVCLVPAAVAATSPPSPSAAATGLTQGPNVAGARGDSLPPGEDARPPTVRAERAAAPPTIDGRIDEVAWEGAEIATGFTQMQPDPGAPASQRTEVRILYDDQALYVAARLYDTAPDSVVAQLGRRDSRVYSDWFFVGIDSYHDRRTAFTFGVNPRGVLVDLLLHNDTEEDISWDAVWDGAAERGPDGWTAELRIPLSQLRFSGAGDGQPWGVNFQRTVARSGEESFWAPVLPDDARMVSLFGELEGLRDLEPPRRLEVMPYALASATAAPGEAADPFHREVDPFGGVGADLKAGITSDLTLTATINPDFGQVEADPSVVNLTAFETFFPEKRPFFVEGVDIFRFGLGIGDGDMGNESLFYSRRVGRAPQGDLDGDYTQAPDATTILAAAKLSGKTASGWSIGVLDAVTAEETGRFVEDGVRDEVPIEPMTNYGVARVIKDFRGGRSAVGGIFTTTHRSLPGGGELDWLRRAAYTGGVDVRHRFGNDMYSISASLVGSRVVGTAEAIDEIQTSPVHYFQRPDADHLDYDPSRTSLNGFAGKLELWKLQGNWRFAVFGQTSSPGFEANDLGFQTSSDLAMGGFWAGYRQYEPGKIFRRWSIGTNGWTGRTYGGELASLGGNVNGGFQLNNFWGASAGINYNTEAYSTSMLRGGPSFLRPPSWSLWSHMYSDRRRAVRLDASFNAGGNPGTDGEWYSVSPGVSIRPSDNADLHLGPSFSWRRNVLQYVDEATVGDASEWLLGTVEQTTVAMTVRLNYTFTPTLSLQLYAQPFISAGDYSAFKVVNDPRADAFDDRVRTLDGDAVASSVVDGDREYSVDLDGDGAMDHTFEDPSFSFKQLRSNLVLRWEYRPGSTVFLVWSQGRTDSTGDGRFRFGDDLADLWGARGTNVLMLKVSYWMGL
ncbi:MAG: DUF5916 domain-containing protein [Candidatus Longimicrobiales bacterium M2_2A_002]